MPMRRRGGSPLQNIENAKESMGGTPMERMAGTAMPR